MMKMSFYNLSYETLLDFLLHEWISNPVIISPFFTRILQNCSWCLYISYEDRPQRHCVYLRPVHICFILDKSFRVRKAHNYFVV